MVHRYVQSGMVSTVGMLIVCLCGVSHGALVSQPPELNPGDQNRLVFTTSTVTDATSSDIIGYIALVRAVASASPFPVFAQTWNSIGSTDSRDARDNTKTNPVVDGTGVQIYLVDGTKIEDDNTDAWDRTIQTLITVTELDSRPAGAVGWSGTDSSGVRLLSGALGAAISDTRFAAAAIAISLLLFHAMYFRGL